jgi:hypothetical protein
MTAEARGPFEHGWRGLAWVLCHICSFGPRGPSLTSCALGASRGKILTPKKS